MVSFRYMTPAKARFANTLFRLLPVPFYLCLLADAAQAAAGAYGIDAAPVRYAQVYLGIIYDVYSYAGQIFADLFYSVVLKMPPQSRFYNAALLFGSGAIVTILASSFFRVIESRDYAPAVLSPIIGSRANVSISPDEVRFGRKKFPYREDGHFKNEDSPRTRNRLSRTFVDEQSKTLYFAYGANPIPVVTIFGIEKAENITAGLNHIMDPHNLYEILRQD